MKKKKPTYRDPIRYKAIADYENEFKKQHANGLVGMLTDVSKKLVSFVK